jgi:hypothetical protein
MRGENKKCLHNLSENLRGRNHLEEPGVYDRIILKSIIKIGSEDVDWIQVAKDKAQYRAIINMAMNIPQEGCLS